MAAADVGLEAIGLLPKLDPNPSPEEVGKARGESDIRAAEAKDVCISMPAFCWVEYAAGALME